MRLASGFVCAATLMATLVYAGPARAQTSQTPPPPATTSSSQTTQTPPPELAPPTALSADQLARIRQALTRESTIKIDDGRMMIYVEVIGKWPTFAEISKGYDLINGPTSGGNPMSHNEFLSMVTPREMYGSGGISAPEVLTMALVNYFGQKFISKGIKEISETRDQKKIEQIRARIDAELAAIRKGGL